MGRKKLDRATLAKNCRARPRRQPPCRPGEKTGRWVRRDKGEPPTRRGAQGAERTERAGGDVDGGGGWIAGGAAVVEEAEPEVAEALAGPLRPRPLPPLRA